MTLLFRMMVLMAACSACFWPWEARAQMPATEAGEERQMQEGGPRDRHERRFERMQQRVQKIYDQLDLSEAQRKLLDENKSRHQAAAKELGRQMKETMKAMGEELKKPDMNMAALNALHAQSRDLRGRMDDDLFNSMLEVRKILTQEQFAKFSELLHKQKGR